MYVEALWKLLMTLYWFPNTLLTLVVLSIATYYDVKYREVDPKLFLAVIPGGVLVYVFLYPLFSQAGMAMSLTLTCIIVVSSYLLARKGVMGKGDPYLIAVVGVLNPYTVSLRGIPATPLILTLVFGIVYVFALMIANTVYNVKRIRVFKELTRNACLFEKIYYFLVGRVMTVEEFRRKKYYFPLVTEGSKRLVARVGYEPLEGSEYDIKGSYLIASQGFAFASLLLVGYVLYLILPFILP